MSDIKLISQHSLQRADGSGLDVQAVEKDNATEDSDRNLVVPEIDLEPVILQSDNSMEVAAPAEKSSLQTEPQPAKIRKARSFKAHTAGGDVSASRIQALDPLPFHLEKIELGSIYGAHPQVRKILEEVSIPLRKLPSETLTEAGLLDLACHLPLHAVREGGKLFCIGGIQLFLLLKNGLREDMEIPVFIYEDFKGSKLRDQILFDLYIMPVICSLTQRDRKSIRSTWEKLKLEKTMERSLLCDPISALNRMLDIDPRTTRNADNASDSPRSK